FVLLEGLFAGLELDLPGEDGVAPLTVRGFEALLLLGQAKLTRADRLGLTIQVAPASARLFVGLVLALLEFSPIRLERAPSLRVGLFAGIREVRLIAAAGFLTPPGLVESRLHRRGIGREALPDFLKAGLSRREGLVSVPKGSLERADRSLSNLDSLGLRGDFG